MVNQLEKIDQLDGHQLKIVDINTDQDLVARYGSRIPILIANGTILCQFQLDRDAVINYIAQAYD